MKFVQLRTRHGETIGLNPDAIASVSPSGSMTTRDDSLVSMRDGKSYIVAGSVVDTLQAIAAAVESTS